MSASSSGKASPAIWSLRSPCVLQNHGMSIWGMGNNLANREYARRRRRQRMTNSQKPCPERGMPTHQQLVLPVLRSLSELDGSAKSRENLYHVIDSYPDAERHMEMV